MNPLKVLITNIWLADRAGSEVVVRDLAVGLLRRGHRPIVYSPTLGEVADEIAAQGVAVIDDLRKLGEQPDVLHAHHSIPCGEVLLRYPKLPAIFVCHAFAHWVETPVHFPQIGAYVAVDQACRDRLVQAEGIEPDRVTIIPNAVDLRRVPPRPHALHTRPIRAAAFGKAADVPQFRVACERAGVEFQTLGPRAGRELAEPERELVQYDLVFASARAAIESLCCGCAVIVGDTRGMAGLVTPENYEALRLKNFGLRSLVHEITVEHCLEQISRYDAEEAMRVAERARIECDLEKSLDSFEGLYSEVLDGKRRPTFTCDQHAEAAARFLHENLPRRPGDQRWPWLGERERILESHQKMEEALRDSQNQIAALKRSRMLKLGRFLRRITFQDF